MLVVEAHAELRRVLTEAFEIEGYEVVTANDEAGALGVLDERPIDLLVCEVDDLARDGETPLLEVERAHPQLPLIVITGSRQGPGLYFGPWETVGTRRTLRRPFKLGDVVAAAREAVTETAEAGS